MVTTNQLLGSRIRELRKTTKLSQEQLSEIIGVDPKHMSRIELGKSFSSLDTLEAIARTFHVELKDLFDFSHLESRSNYKKQIDELLDGVNEEKLKLVYKITKALLK
ncbi:MAG TPA: helix-turn-helix transcriptional regulator [Desulfuromonadales bacterium]|nr:helix-turn-helix transcriptional regulator [Desulfuromonadales bacterium]